MAGKNRSRNSELDSLIASQKRDMKKTSERQGEIRGKDKRRAKREALTLAEREKELNFDRD